jgi:signal transduction histidine kinase/CheY-like chemotaxis protein
MFYSIKSKLVLTLISLLAIIALSIFLYFPGKYEQMQMEALLNNSRSINMLISYSLRPALFFEDKDNLKEVVSGAKRNKNITYIVVVHSQQGILAEYNYPLAKKIIFNDVSNPIDSKNLLLKTVEPIIHDDKTIGYLYTGYSLAEIKKQIQESRYLIALISIVLFLIGSAFVYFISKYSLRTLDDIIRTAKKISSGDMSIRAVEPNDEIGEVAKTFNLMMDDLEISQGKLKSWNQKLEEQVKERTINLENEIEERKRTEIELIKAKETAEEMNRLKTNFLANMSHEIRTPLIGILGYADIIQNETKDSETKEMAGIIKKSGDRLHDTLNQILDLSKAESEISKVKPEKTNISQLINETVNLYKIAALEKGLQLIFNKDVNEVYADVEQNLFINLMNNLLNNAVKYTNKGKITVGLKSYFDKIIIEVRDTGVGIPKEMLDTIFEPFRQVSEGLARRFEGTGLGLTLAKKYIRIMNGEIEVESLVNTGSIFRIILPATSVTTNGNLDSGLNVLASTKRNLKKKAKIFLVENDDICINTLKMFLKDKYQLDVCKDSEKAMEIIKNTEYDIFLLDIGLSSKYNGIDIVREIRKTDINGYKPVVAVTAYVMPGDEERLKESGFSHYLPKPFFKNDILELIDEILMQPVSS